MKSRSNLASLYKLGIFIVVAAAFAGLTTAQATTLPLNNLNRQDTGAVSQIDENLFMAIATTITETFAPYAAKHGAKLMVRTHWEDSTVNAYASKNADRTEWYIDMFGGLARRPEITPDGFALVVCHELGHHFGGYPFYDGRPMSSEGEADYYATQVCARKIWKNDPIGNLRILKKAQEYPEVVYSCNMNWRSENDRALCVRSTYAGISLASLLSVLAEAPALPGLEFRNKNVVEVTNPRHPEAQCRLDTYMAGALCTGTFDLNRIPGLDDATGTGDNGALAERTALANSCRMESRISSTGGVRYGARPLCWFKPLTQKPNI